MSVGAEMVHDSDTPSTQQLGDKGMKQQQVITLDDDSFGVLDTRSGRRSRMQ
jgi:hypothetical protein